MVIEVSAAQPAKALRLTYSRLSGKVTDCSWYRSSQMATATPTVPFLKVTLVTVSSQLTAQAPTYCTPPCSVSSEVQPEKASDHMAVTEAGITRSRNAVQF